MLTESHRCKLLMTLHNNFIFSARLQLGRTFPRCPWGAHLCFIGPAWRLWPFDLKCSTSYS